ncbi:MAG: TIM barrel protein [Acidobacteria bacterium]|nr:TIM barrel protein [Acidobacteriota bacterium]
MNRRSLLSSSLLIPGLGRVTEAQTPGRLPIRKGILLGMLPTALSIADRFSLAKECGFQSMECGTEDDPKVAEEILAASRKSGLPIHSVMNRDHWKFPLSSPDPAIVARCVQGMETSIRNAKQWGAETVLLVPAVVNPEVSYQQAWDRSVEQIRKMIPLARESKVIIAVEEVWNKFLLSPIEFARYVDQFQSPWVQAYLDVGNMVLFGYPQDWIRTLGKRIVKLHFKDFGWKFYNLPVEGQAKPVRKRVPEFVNLREGDIDWKAVHKALADIGYKGDATVELTSGNAEYLKDVSHRVDLILEGA